MAEEKVLVFNLRRDALKAPKWRRSKDVASLLRGRLMKFSKSGKVNIDSRISEAIWSRGSRSPLMRLRLRIRKLDDGSVKAELVG